jgi:hypothetical protein
MTINATIKKVNVSFAPSPSPDVIGYLMYYCPENEELTSFSPFVDIGNRTSFVLPDDFPEIGDLDGLYKAAIVAYDEEENMSSSGPEVITPLDFTPPEPAGAITITSVE